MMIEALIETMSVPVPDAHGVIRDVEAAMTGPGQNGGAATDDTVRRRDGDRDETTDRCDDCKSAVGMTGVRCDD